MVRVDGRAWIPKSVLNADHVYNIKADLTIEPRKTSEYSDESPDPIRLFVETESALGVPRGWWDKNNTGKHEVSNLTSEGAPFGPGVVKAGVGWSDDEEWQEQLQATDALIDRLTTNGYGGGIIEAGCAFGKTVTALRIAYRLGRRTLVIVNKGFFTSQWTKRIQEFLPGARIGIIQQSRCEFRDKDIVIAMVHSLAQREYDPALYKAFGLVITDECHRIAAPTWADVIPRFNAMYRLGLTATPRRKDGAEDVFFQHIGSVAFKAKGESVVPLIKRMRSVIELQPVKYPSGSAIPVHKLKTSQIEKQVSEDMVRNTMYADKVVKAVDAGRKVFVVSKFIEHLHVFEGLLEAKLESAGLGHTTIDWVTGQRYVFRRPVLDDDGNQLEQPVMIRQEMLDDDGIPILTKGGNPKYEKVEKVDSEGNVVTELVWEDCERHEGHRYKVLRKVGKRRQRVWKTQQTTEAQLEAAESAQIIMATQQMIEEGFDVQALDVLVPLVPPYDIEQMAGRIRRRCKPKPSKCQRLCPWRAGDCPGKPQPIILEPVDDGVGKLERRHAARMRFYKTIGAFNG